jgi:hypothetical protein
MAARQAEFQHVERVSELGVASLLCRDGRQQAGLAVPGRTPTPVPAHGTASPLMRGLPPQVGHPLGDDLLSDARVDDHGSSSSGPWRAHH